MAVVVVVLFAPGRAHAYAWMIRHGYTECGQCHVDPSGSGLLTPYGRALGEIVLPTSYGEGGEITGKGEFLGGTAELPAWLSLGGDLRYLWMNRSVGDAPAVGDSFVMRADVYGMVSVDRFSAYASVGYAERGALGAAVTRHPDHNLVSREAWLGVKTDTDLYFRVGRLNLPFGIRTVEHTLWVRSTTRTNLNDQQQYGAAVAWTLGDVRGEAMAIAGNFQLRPDDYRERGYSAYAEWAALSGLAVGASSLITHRDLDTRLLVPSWRHAHGAFARWSTPWKPLVLLGELDYVLESPKQTPRSAGIIAMTQADLELLTGLHLALTGELSTFGRDDAGASVSGWASAFWFFLPHMDVRADWVLQSLSAGGERTRAQVWLLQGHLYL